MGKMVKIIKFLFFVQKVSSGMGALRPKLLGTRTPQNGDQRGEGKEAFFFFRLENDKENEKKYFVHFVGNLSRIPKLFFRSSIKTEEVLFFYIYI